MLLDCELIEEHVVLRAEADEGADALHLRAQSVLAEDHVTRGRAQQTRQDREHCRLASAVVALKTKSLCNTIVNLEY